MPDLLCGESGGGGRIMRRHLNYLKYIIRHKWFVYIACLRLKNASLELLWLSVTHDISKFLPSEWKPYAQTFYKPDGSKQYVESLEFSQVWNAHQKRNKHHWQYYLITWDRGNTEPLPMPEIYAWEMVADWMGAGRAITGKWETKEWYEKNKTKIILHEDTRQLIESILYLFPI